MVRILPALVRREFVRHLVLEPVLLRRRPGNVLPDVPRVQASATFPAV